MKAVAFVAVPRVVGGAGLLLSPHPTPIEQASYLSAYAVELGVSFDPGAVRAVVPEGLRPAAGFTGGIAVFGGEDGWALSPLSTGHVWIDVVDEGGAPARYMLTGFASGHHQGGTTIPLDVAALGETHERDGAGILHILAWPDCVTTLALSVQGSADRCVSRLEGGYGRLLASGPGGSLGVIHMPAALDWCEVEAESSEASIVAPQDHVLGRFAPREVLWAQIAIP